MPRSHADYTVAWITALSLELSAGKEMFDEIHSQLPQPPTDTNSYFLGSIAGHNVVMACLPAGVIGITPAATVVAHLRSTFPRIQFGLLVGIGGGVPSANKDIDVRLGDIVVSKPTATYGGVVQYDYGKAIGDGQFQQMGVLNKPPEILLTSISRYQADYRREEKPISSLLSKRDTRTSHMFAHPGQGHDHLFHLAYAHKGSETSCETCDVRGIIHRKQRDSPEEPMIHYGLIASGNQVIKDAMVRDTLAERHGIICFEMEAAGLMNHLPCLVVRGICDYSDSHKNKRWQGYAAMTAAAFARLLLASVPRSSTPRTTETSMFAFILEEVVSASNAPYRG